jgi:hypothetical protein
MKHKDLFLEEIRFKKGKFNEELIIYVRLLLQFQNYMIDGCLYTGKDLELTHII